jgi:hypothetical protein
MSSIIEQLKTELCSELSEALAAEKRAHEETEKARASLYDRLTNEQVSHAETKARLQDAYARDGQAYIDLVDRDATISDLRAKLEEAEASAAEEKRANEFQSRRWGERLSKAEAAADVLEEQLASERQRRETAESKCEATQELVTELEGRLRDAETQLGNAVDSGRKFWDERDKALSDRDDCARELERVTAVAEEALEDARSWSIKYTEATGREFAERKRREEAERASRDACTALNDICTMLDVPCGGELVKAAPTAVSNLRAKYEELEGDLEKAKQPLGELEIREARLRATSGDGLRAAVDSLASRLEGASQTMTFGGTPGAHASDMSSEARDTMGLVGEELRAILASHPAPTSETNQAAIETLNNERDLAYRQLEKTDAQFVEMKARIDKAVGLIEREWPAIVPGSYGEAFRGELLEVLTSTPPAEPKRYIPWANAGGPNECKHGYAAGIPCPDCDRDKAAEPKREAGEVPGCTFDETGTAMLPDELELYAFDGSSLEVIDKNQERAPILTRDQVRDTLVPLLQRFVDTGKLTNGGGE